jgi:hypothetical protein
MRRGLHPVLQVITLVTPDGRVVKAYAGKVQKIVRPIFLKAPGAESENVGQLAKFKKRFEVLPTENSK